jgi:hypothetical protein
MNTTMESMPEVSRTHGGMPAWAFLGAGYDGEKLRLYWPYKSEIAGKRFLTRLIVVRCRWFALDITRIHMPDDGEREWPHDHSRDFWSWKTGCYEEWVYDNPDDLSSRQLRHNRRFTIHSLRHTQAHSITRVSPRLVTVMFLGPKKQKSSYWTPDGKQPTGMKVDQDGEIA